MVPNNLISYSKAVDQKRLNFIITQLKNSIPDNGTVLDVGCGNGIISMNLGILGYQVHGIDISDKAITRARQINTLKNVKFDVISAEELTAVGKTYDAIICSEVLEHLHEPTILLKTLFNILKINGKLIVTVPNGKGPRETLVTKPMLKLRTKNNWMWKGIFTLKKVMGYNGTTIQSDADNLDHIQFFTKSDLYLLSKKNDFEIITFKNTNFIEDVFPFSLVTNKVNYLQQLDCKLADILPHTFSGGFNMVWKKNA